MNYKDVPASVVIEQSQRYTNQQMRLIYEDDIVLDMYTKRSIKLLYEKAESLNDETTTSLLAQKYDMMAIFERDISGLPQVSNEQVDVAFEDIYEFIKDINPYSDSFIINRRNADITKLNKNPRNRTYGSHVFKTCFKKTKDGVFFSMKSYLYKTSTETVRCLARMLNGKIKMSKKLVCDIR